MHPRSKSWGSQNGAEGVAGVAKWGIEVAAGAVVGEDGRRPIAAG